MIVRSMLTALVLSLLCSSATAQTLGSAVLSILLEDVAKPGSAFSRDMMTRISAATGLEGDSLQSGLQGLLDELDGHRKSKDADWQVLTDLGSPDVKRKKMDRVLREFIGWGHKAATGKGNYGLALVIERSAEKAKIPRDRAR
jgi:hypothetical protein